MLRLIIFAILLYCGWYFFSQIDWSGINTNVNQRLENEKTVTRVINTRQEQHDRVENIVKEKWDN